MTEDKLYNLIEGAIDAIDEVGCDALLLTVAESAEFYASIAAHCEGWNQTLQIEMDQEED